MRYSSPDNLYAVSPKPAYALLVNCKGLFCRFRKRLHPRRFLWMWRSHSLLWLISWISCALLQEIMKAAKAFQVRAQDISPLLFLLFLKFSWGGKSTELWHTMNCSFTHKPASCLNPDSRNLQVPLIPFQLPVWHLDTQVTCFSCSFQTKFLGFLDCKLQDLT